MDVTSSGHVVAYYSVAGTTALVAGWIQQALQQAGCRVATLDLTRKGRPQGPGPDEIGPGDCLWVLSPVYVQHALPRVMDFIQALPQSPGRPAVPVVTYGAVCSGVALPEMGRALSQRGCKIMGGAKMLSEHSMMWPYDNPLGQGRPSQEDQAQIQGLVARVLGSLSGGEPAALELSALDYQPPQIQEMAATRSLDAMIKMVPPMSFDQAKLAACADCGKECVKNCPQANISFNQGPNFGQDCQFCLHCMRVCPSGAISNPMVQMLEQELNKRAQAIGEPAQTLVF